MIFWTFIKGMLLGLGVGAVLGMLYAPKSGKELREDIKRKSDEAKKKGQEQFQKYRQKFADQYDETENMLAARFGADLDKSKKAAIKQELKNTFERIKEIAEE